MRLQAQAEALYFIADLHAITTVRDGATLRQNSLDTATDYLALGLDPKRSVLFCQSAVPQHAELCWILSTIAPMSLLERAHSYKDKVARGIAANVGLFTYPVLMAADILLYNADAVPVGQDQKQHLEIARDLATKFNLAYVPHYSPQDPMGLRGGQPGILRLPEAIMVSETAIIPGTDGQKMSKSYNNTLDLFGDEAALRKKIMGIRTDSAAVDGPKTEPSVLLDLLRLLAPPDELAQIEADWRQGGLGYGTFKQLLLDCFMATFGAARARRQALAAAPDYVHQVLQDGAERARTLAAPTWAAVTAAVGCGRSGA